MQSMRLISVLLLFSLQPQPNCSSLGLTCVNDYINKTTCNWDSSGIPPGVDCGLHGTITITRQIIILSSCDLKPSEDSDHTLRSCHLNFDTVFSFKHKITIDVQCENSTVASLKDYKPALKVKMYAPGKPVIQKNNISWSLGQPHSRRITEYSFQMQYKLSAQPWEGAVSWNISNQQTSVELNDDWLVKGRDYDARVRVKPSDRSSIKGVWSNWSPTASWWSEVGRSPVQHTISPSTVQGSFLGLIIGPVTAVVVLMLLVTCKCHGAGCVYKLQFSHVPNPYPYFRGLDTVHGGNFREWLSPLFAPESFEVPQCFEDISPVEVFKAKDITALLYKDHSRGPAEQWDSSAGSSCFSNMGYFYSKYPDSYEIEPCPVYFSYKKGERSAEEERGVESVMLDDGPVQAEEPQHPDPGCRVWNQDQESSEEEKSESCPGEMDDPSPPQNILPFRLAGPIPSSSSLFPHHLPGFPLPPIIFQGIDSGMALDSSDNSDPMEGALGRSSSVKVAPSSGGYVSLKDMQNTYCNKSI